MKSRAAGFTLIEMLVALALVALMSVAMLEAYRFSQRTLLQTTRVEATAHDIAGAQRLLRRLIEHAYPFESTDAGRSAGAPHGLAGDSRKLELSAPASAHLGGVGHYRYSIELNQDGALEVSWLLDRNGTPASDAPTATQHEAILSGAASIAIDYLELIERGSGQIEPNWRDNWIDKSDLPALVRIRVVFPPNDRRQWPELIVAPRISADANCVFDVVSQVCRITS